MKKFLSLILAVLMIATCLPVGVFATEEVNQTQVLERINELYDFLGGKYFTSDQKICTCSGIDFSSRCYNVNVLNATWFKNIFGTVDYNNFSKHACVDSTNITKNAWSCAGFANFAFWYIFKNTNSDTVTSTTVARGIKFTQDNLSKYARPGDIIRIGDSTSYESSAHSIIYISHDSNGITGLDSNYNNDNCVRKTIYPYSTNRPYISITRATNYNVSDTPNIQTEILESFTKKTVYTTVDDVVVEWNTISNASYYGLTIKNNVTNQTVFEDSGFKGNEINVGTLPIGTYRYNMLAYSSSGAPIGDVSQLKYFDVVDKTYIVSYDANGGISAPTAQTKTHNVTLELSNITPTRIGYTFKGWATSANGAVSYSAGADFTANADTTLYAVWSINPNVDAVTTKNVYTTNESVVLNWNSVPDADYYGLTVKNDSTEESVFDNKVYNTTINLGKLKSGTYRYTIAAFTSNGALIGKWTTLKYFDVEEAVVTVIGVALNKTTAALTEGDTLSLTATITPSNATNKNVTWTSSNEGVATVANGIVTAKSAGTAIITVKTADGSKTATCTVTVNAPVIPDVPTNDIKANIYTEAPKSAVQGSTFSYKVYLEGTYDGYAFKLPVQDGFTITDVTGADGVDVTDINGTWLVSVIGGLEKNEAQKELIVTVTVSVAKDAELGDREISLDEIMVTTDTGDAVGTLESYFATINITDQLPGDINGDGEFNYLDVSKLYALFRNKTTIPEYIITDINGDKEFNYLDVSKLYAIFRGKANFN